MVKDITRANLILGSCFPKINKDKKYKATSEETRRYNCIAWAMRFTDRWVQPMIGEAFWWPKFHSNPNFDMSQNGLKEAFRLIGFHECGDDSLEPWYDKVALYYNWDTMNWTHAARVVGKNEYHSKAGRLYDFHHDNMPLRLYNPDISQKLDTYGKTYVCMKRHKLLRSYSYYLMFKRYIFKCAKDPSMFKDYTKLLFSDFMVLIEH